MNIYVDIDETICTTPDSRDYRDSQPLTANIRRINGLFEQGHTITYWTARGTMTGIDWREVTEGQFEKWGVKYHALLFGKPAYDLYVDDKSINTAPFMRGEMDLDPTKT